VVERVDMNQRRPDQADATVETAKHREVAAQGSDVGIGAVVDTNRHHIAAGLDVWRDVEPERGVAALMPADPLAVDIDLHPRRCRRRRRL
jgi:hypothetical protein